MRIKATELILLLLVLAAGGFYLLSPDGGGDRLVLVDRGDPDAPSAVDRSAPRTRPGGATGPANRPPASVPLEPAGGARPREEPSEIDPARYPGVRRVCRHFGWDEGSGEARELLEWSDRHRRGIAAFKRKLKKSPDQAEKLARRFNRTMKDHLDHLRNITGGRLDDRIHELIPLYRAEGPEGRLVRINLEGHPIGEQEGEGSGR